MKDRKTGEGRSRDCCAKHRPEPFGNEGLASNGQRVLDVGKRHMPRHLWIFPFMSVGLLSTWSACDRGAQGRLHCLTLNDGRLIWSRPLNDEYAVEAGMFPVASSPLLDGERLILNVGGRHTEAGIVALDKHTGRTLWTATGDGASCATPRAAAMHGRHYVFVWTSENLVALDSATGHEWWSIHFRPNHPDTINATSPVFGPRHVRSGANHAVGPPTDSVPHGLARTTTGTRIPATNRRTSGGRRFHSGR